MVCAGCANPDRRSSVPWWAVILVGWSATRKPPCVNSKARLRAPGEGVRALEADNFNYPVEASAGDEVACAVVCGRMTRRGNSSKDNSVKRRRWMRWDASRAA
jgi:hypothetical protein